MYVYYACINDAFNLKCFNFCDSSSQCEYSNCDAINTILKISSIIFRCKTYKPGIIFDSHIFILGLVFIINYDLFL